MTFADLLRRQHREVIGLFTQLRRTPAAAERSRLIDHLRNHLTLHRRLEEEILYPAVAAAARGKALRRRVPVLIEQHEVIGRVLVDWQSADPAVRRFAARAAVARELVAAHVAEEEEIFSVLER